VFVLTREISDTGLASRFDGEPMVQSFTVDGYRGRVWITTAEALTIPGFGREWVAARLAERPRKTLRRDLAAGLRLRAAERALALAA
jgi:hypothetical protein